MKRFTFSSVVSSFAQVGLAFSAVAGLGFSALVGLAFPALAGDPMDCFTSYQERLAVVTNSSGAPEYRSFVNCVATYPTTSRRFDRVIGVTANPDANCYLKDDLTWCTFETKLPAFTPVLVTGKFRELLFTKEVKLWFDKTVSSTVFEVLYTLPGTQELRVGYTFSNNLE